MRLAAADGRGGGGREEDDEEDGRLLWSPPPRIPFIVNPSSSASASSTSDVARGDVEVTSAVPFDLSPCRLALRSPDCGGELGFS